MKNVLISLVALAALSSAALASDRSYDLRDSDTYFGKYSAQLKANRTPHARTATEAFAVVKTGKKLTNFERMMKISEENDQASK